MPIRLFSQPSHVALGLSLATAGAVACTSRSKSIQTEIEKHKPAFELFFSKAVATATEISHESLLSIGLGHLPGGYK